MWKPVIHLGSTIGVLLAAIAGLAFLINFSETEAIGYDNCHMETSLLGKQTALAAASFSEAMNLSDEDLNFCTGGFIHGAAEGQLKKSPNLLAEARSLCDLFPQTNRPYFYQTCVHGIGHGLMAATVNNLPKALNLCEESFSGSAHFQQVCAEGVFMENFDAGHGQDKAEASPYMSPEDLMHPCPSQPELYKESCYLHVAEHFYSHQPEAQYEKAFEFCMGAETAYRDACVRNAAKRMMQNNLAKPKEMEIFCSSIEKGFSGDCIYGLASGYGEFFFGFKKGEEFCRRILYPNNRQFCPELWR